jgi:hypothetical protein
MPDCCARWILQKILALLGTLKVVKVFADAASRCWAGCGRGRAGMQPMKDNFLYLLRNLRIR